MTLPTPSQKSTKTVTPSGTLVHPDIDKQILREPAASAFNMPGTSLLVGQAQVSPTPLLQGFCLLGKKERSFVWAFFLGSYVTCTTKSKR